MVAARYIYFTINMKAMAAFYRDVLGMKAKANGNIADNPDEFLQLASGDFEIALHWASKPGGGGRNKLVFFARDVAATRERLIVKGVRMGKLFGEDKLQLCDFKDPDGNTLQISNR